MLSSSAGVGQVVTANIAEYGAYVNSLRALPVYADGLKPVARRILHAMFTDLKLRPAGKTRKSMAVVGAVTGSYHPHGDSSVYDSLVGLVHERYPLIVGQGNFGNAVCGSLVDPPAAPRYTECKLSPIGARLFDGIDVVECTPTYDDEGKEPVKLPSRLPLLFMNGTEGIGVGVSSSMPAHNLREIALAIRWLIENDSGMVRAQCHVRAYEIMEKLMAAGFRGPDPGIGQLLTRPADLCNMYASGFGTVRYRCKYHFEDASGKKKHRKLVIDEYCPRFSPTEFLTKCAGLAEQDFIVSASDESTLKGGRIVTRLTVSFKDAGPVMDRVIPLLEKSVSMHFNVVDAEPASVAGEDPRYTVKTDVGLPVLLQTFIEWRRTVEKRVLARDEAAHKVELARLQAIAAGVKNRRKLIGILESGTSEADSLASISKELGLTLDQAKVLWTIQLRQLARVSEAKLNEDIGNVESALAAVRAEMQDINGRILRMLDEDVKLFGDDRGTTLAADAESVEVVGSASKKAIMLHIGDKPKLERLNVERFTTGRRKFLGDRLIVACEFFWLVYKSAHCRRVQLSYVSDGEHTEWLRPNDPIVDVVSDMDSLMVITTSRSEFIVLSTVQSSDSFNASSSENVTVVSAEGMRPGQSGLVYGLNAQNKKRSWGRKKPYAWWLKKARRRGAMAKRLWKDGTNLRFARYDDHTRFIHHDGKGYFINPNSPAKLTSPKAQPVRAYDSNLIILSDGRKRREFPDRLVKAWIRRAEPIKFILPWSEWSFVTGNDADDQDAEVATAEVDNEAADDGGEG